MPILDIRRHAERQNLADNQSALSVAGREMCERLAKSAPKYALVVSSPLPRAKETAQRIAARYDGIEPGLLPDLGGRAANVPRDAALEDWARLLDEEPDARRFAEEQLPVWARIAARAGDKDLVLAVSHGGIIELPAIVLARRLGASLGNAAFNYCEGVHVTYAKAAPVKIEVLRV
jgi:broad specificity phosphatase PhoE